MTQTDREKLAALLRNEDNRHRLSTALGSRHPSVALKDGDQDVVVRLFRNAPSQFKDTK